MKRILPFPLTGAQRRVLREIADDLRSPHPMNRLVQGDVGSGKTLVALLAMVVVLENGHQAAFMAPTEILAEQHFLTLRRLLKRCPYRVELLTSAVKGTERAADARPDRLGRGADRDRHPRPHPGGRRASSASASRSSTSSTASASCSARTCGRRATTPTCS